MGDMTSAAIPAPDDTTVTEPDGTTVTYDDNGFVTAIVGDGTDPGAPIAIATPSSLDTDDEGSAGGDGGTDGQS